jgi:hypothetical protein
MMFIAMSVVDAVTAADLSRDGSSWNDLLDDAFYRITSLDGGTP